MKIVQFVGPLGAIPGRGQDFTLHPRCQGEASLPDDARGDLVHAAPMCLLKHTTEKVTQLRATGKWIGPPVIPEIMAAVGAAASAELGVKVQISSLTLTLSDEDRAAMSARAKEGRAAAIERQRAYEAETAAKEDPANYYPANAKVVRFAGSLGAMPLMGITVHPDCRGHASLPSDARDDVVQVAPACLMKHVAEQVRATRSYESNGVAPEREGPLRAAISAAASGDLGVAVNVGLLCVEPSEQDMADLTDRYPDSVAFFNMAEESALLTHCARASGRPDFEIWGLDQEFLGAGGWLLDMILAEPLSAPARASMQKLRAEETQDAELAKVSGDPVKLFLFNVSDAPLEAAQELLAQGGSERSRQLLASIMTTHKIYKENVEGSPRANHDRAVLLKKEFLSRLHGWQGSGKGGKILLKFGEWHLYRGYNPLGQRDLGNFVAEYADVKDTPSLHIAVLGSRGVHALYGGYARAMERSAFVMSDDPRYQWLKVAADVAEPNGWMAEVERRIRSPRSYT